MIDIVNMRVLICDDMESMCKSIRGMLKVLNFGSHFRYAHNGREALNLLRETPCDLLIVDWNMPVMTGIDLVGRIREDKNLRDLPVIMITAENNREIVAEAAESDIDAYILKPLTVKSLGDRITSVVEKVNDPPPMIRLLQNARVLEEAGKFDEAIKAAMQAAQADKNSSKPFREIGLLYYKKGDHTNAEKFLLKAAKMNKLDVFAFHYLGEIYLERKDIEKATLYFDKAMRISPRHISRGIYFGKVLVQNNNAKKAVQVFEKAISLSSNPLQIQEEIANFCLASNVPDYAAKLIEYILKSTPNRYDLMYSLALAYETLEDHKNALALLTQLEKKDPENIEIPLHLAINYMAIGQVLRADEKLGVVLKMDPEHPQALEMRRQNI